jgi:hypothetical protein
MNGRQRKLPAVSLFGLFAKGFDQTRLPRWDPSRKGCALDQ